MIQQREKFNGLLKDAVNSLYKIQTADEEYYFFKTGFDTKPKKNLILQKQTISFDYENENLLDKLFMGLRKLRAFVETSIVEKFNRSDSFPLKKPSTNGVDEKLKNEEKYTIDSHPHIKHELNTGSTDTNKKDISTQLILKMKEKYALDRIRRWLKKKIYSLKIRKKDMERCKIDAFQNKLAMRNHKIIVEQQKKLHADLVEKAKSSYF